MLATPENRAACFERITGEIGALALNRPEDATVAAEDGTIIGRSAVRIAWISERWRRGRACRAE